MGGGMANACIPMNAWLSCLCGRSTIQPTHTATGDHTVTAAGEKHLGENDVQWSVT